MRFFFGGTGTDGFVSARMRFFFGGTGTDGFVSASFPSSFFFEDIVFPAFSVAPFLALLSDSFEEVVVAATVIGVIGIGLNAALGSTSLLLLSLLLLYDEAGVVTRFFPVVGFLASLSWHSGHIQLSLSV